MKIESKHLFIASGVLIAGAIGYNIYRRKKGKIIYDELMGRITGSGSNVINDTPKTDSKGNPIVWSTTNYWSKVDKKKLISDAEATKIASNLYAVLVKSSKETDKINAFKAIKTQANGSKVYYTFQKLYGFKGTRVIMSYYDLMSRVRDLKDKNTQAAIQNYMNGLPLS